MAFSSHSSTLPGLSLLHQKTGTLDLGDEFEDIVVLLHRYRVENYVKRPFYLDEKNQRKFYLLKTL